MGRNVGRPRMRASEVRVLEKLECSMPMLVVEVKPYSGPSKRNPLYLEKGVKNKNGGVRMRASMQVGERI